MRRRLPIIVLTVAYAALALYGLGSLRAPATSWQATAAGEGFVLDLGSRCELARLHFFFGVGKATWEVALSDDGVSWRGAGSLPQRSGMVFKWISLALSGHARYVRVIASTPGGVIHEVAAIAAGDLLPATVVAVTPAVADDRAPPGVSVLVDEQALFPARTGFSSGTVFDEVYFARTAYEHLHGLRPYEVSHPPLGKLLIAAGIAVFGFGPFGWRVVSALAGVALLPLIWALAARLTRRPEVGLLAASLLACDFLHFTHSRMAAVDVFIAVFTLLALLFMIRFTGAGGSDDGAGRPLWLLLSGLSFGAGVACKWSAAFVAPSLAALFLTWSWRTHRRRVGGRSRALLAAFAWALVGFVVLPAIVYLLTYVPFLRLPGPGYRFADLVPLHRAMLAYHGTLTEEFPDSSRWWEWPLVRTPVRYAIPPPNLPPGKTVLVVGMGNPAVWWPGIAAVAYAVFRRRAGRAAGLDVALLAFASVYLPWALVPRHTFLYHFFPAVPLLVLALAIMVTELADRGRFTRRLAWVHVAAAAGLFAAFYPILAGTPVAADYVENWLRWFRRWPF